MVAPMDVQEALTLAGAPLPELMARAAEVRDRGFGRVVTYSPKVFLPVTNLCRNRCGYCSFRRSPGDPGEHTMAPDEIERWLDRAATHGCSEALLCLGDTPETGFGRYRATLRQYGHARTVDYLEWTAERALARGLLPHTNAGILSRADMARLRRVNVSLGLMLESVSERLCEPGMPHHRAPDKRPARRIAMSRQAGELRIAFTSGVLIGIGETLRERVETLLAIAALHAEHAHIQEVIVQPFRARPDVAMADAAEPVDDELLQAVALARLLLPPDVSVQSPPNLGGRALTGLLAAGLDDLGGISPVTPDYINPRHPWPHLTALHERCERLGFALRPRLPVHPRMLLRDLLDAGLEAPVRRQARRLDDITHPSQLPAATATAEARP